MSSDRGRFKRSSSGTGQRSLASAETDVVADDEGLGEVLVDDDMEELPPEYGAAAGPAHKAQGGGGVSGGGVDGSVTFSALPDAGGGVSGEGKGGRQGALQLSGSSGEEDLAELSMEAGKIADMLSGSTVGHTSMAVDAPPSSSGAGGGGARGAAAAAAGEAEAEATSGSPRVRGTLDFDDDDDEEEEEGRVGGGGGGGLSDLSSAGSMDLVYGAAAHGEGEGEGPGGLGFGGGAMASNPLAAGTEGGASAGAGAAPAAAAAAAARRPGTGGGSSDDGELEVCARMHVVSTDASLLRASSHAHALRACRRCLAR